MKTSEILYMIAKGLSETNTKCNGLTIHINEDDTFICRLNIKDPQLFDLADFADVSGFEADNIHIPDKILTENDKHFRDNDEYITIKN